MSTCCVRTTGVLCVVLCCVCVVQVGPRQWERVLEMVRRIRGLGMEVRGQEECNGMGRERGHREARGIATFWAVRESDSRGSTV